MTQPDQTGGARLTALVVSAAAAIALALVAAGVGRYPVAVAFAGGLVASVAVQHVVTRVARRRATSVEARRGYRWRQATYTYVIGGDDPRHHRQSVDVTIEAVRDGVDAFTNQYRWSGSGDDGGPVVRSPGHAFVAEVRPALGWRSYDVRIDPLRKGETTTVSLVQELYDKGEKFDPYLGKSVYEAMDRLVLRVVLPPGLRPWRAQGLEREGAGPEAPELSRVEVPAHDAGTAGGTADGTAAGSTVVEWEVLHPTVGRNYVLTWDYRDGGMYEVAEPAGGDAPRP